ncbi:hypothetical protein BDW74DRAFT_174788 [Aspergillus multicolor]|uniref:uncharacterized protein n=1 Tax=Aspergillus multicolor TaxID=41759 RepID=UPI003CCD76E6
MLARTLLVLGLMTALPVYAQDCSAANPCATGCCSKSGYCGIGDEYCGAGCVVNCDFQAECDANRPCANDACCSKAGFCGLGPDCEYDDMPPSAAMLTPDLMCTDCSPESCVSGCDNRAYCDPGGYEGYAEHSKCPLNVCCSKYGYCGITEEFCGDKKVKRPSADYNGYTPLNTIVGYYEGWSRDRKCHTFFPEQIPLGIYTVELDQIYYTHLNYAFATIDPESFEVKLASSTEADLVRRLAGLKAQDPDLKVFVAIGGWAYNDPGPTRTTFSDLAASQDAQKKFFKSLISFLSTYNLDGVDIDWEYPGPDDIVERGGREEDFKNFPVFMQRLKQALKGAGGRDGITITLPASYWFLQYFDIVKLEKYVDFFNMMTYDLHGAWDRGNKWLGPYLNAHTNLTEIQDAMDLLWRNKISSKKVILGTGFYGRAFTATSESCMEPGCTYESAANKGPCSNENGILLNSEIVDIIEEKGLKPKLYKEAGVKVVHWDNQWVAYDDEETLELKAQFALGQALGGVMVWAVSHDTPNRRFSNSFYTRTINRHGMTSKTFTNTSEYVEVKKTVDQCKWTNCGQTCPSGWLPAMRYDKNAKPLDLMLDSTGCDGSLHTLCCPEDSMPTCGWYIHTNSFCNYQCPDGMVEVGSTQGGCHSGYQAACCSLKWNGDVRHSMDVWGQCLWAGATPNCAGICPAQHKSPQLESTSGSGAVKCSDSTARKYCCQEQEGNQWGEGDWNWLDPDKFHQDRNDPDECVTDCSWGQYRLAMQQSGPCKDKPGAMSFCADNLHYDTQWKERQNITDIRDGLRHFFESPTCPNTSGVLAKRATPDSKALDVTDFVLTYILKEMYHNSDTLVNYIRYWNEAIEDFYPNLVFPGLREKLAETYENIFAFDLQQFVDTFLCYLKSFNDFFSSTPALTCGISDPCDSEDSDCESDEWDDPCLSETGSLDKRAARRSYCVTYPNPNGQGGDLETTVRSGTYDTSGELPSNSTVRDRAVVYRNFADCADSELMMVRIANGNIFNGRRVHNEHETELNTESRFLSDIAHGRLDDNTPNAYTPIPAAFLAAAWLNGQVINTTTYGLPVGYRANDRTNLQLWIPSVRIYEAYGSRRNTANFFLLDAYLNFLKNRCWMWRRWNRGPLADSSMQRYIDDVADPDQALWRLRSVISVYRYLNAEEVRRGLRAQYREIGNERWTVNRAWNDLYPAQAFDIRPYWPRWYQNHIQGMIRTSTAFMNRWLDAMEAQWSGRTGRLADRVNEDIARLKRQVNNGAINIRIDDF